MIELSDLFVACGRFMKTFVIEPLMNSVEEAGSEVGGKQVPVQKVNIMKNHR